MFVPTEMKLFTSECILRREGEREGGREGGREGEREGIESAGK